MFKYIEQILDRQKPYSELRLMQHLVDVSTEKCLINCAFFRIVPVSHCSIFVSGAGISNGCLWNVESKLKMCVMKIFGPCIYTEIKQKVFLILNHHSIIVSVRI